MDLSNLNLMGAWEASAFRVWPQVRPLFVSFFSNIVKQKLYFKVAQLYGRADGVSIYFTFMDTNNCFFVNWQ